MDAQVHVDGVGKPEGTFRGETAGDCGETYLSCRSLPAQASDKALQIRALLRARRP